MAGVKTAYPDNLLQVTGRLVRDANFSDKYGKALFGTLLVSSTRKGRYGDDETVKTYLDFRIVDPKLVEKVQEQPTTEGGRLFLAGRVYMSEDREDQNRETGEVKVFRGRITIHVADEPDHKAENLGHG